MPVSGRQPICLFGCNHQIEVITGRLCETLQEAMDAARSSAPEKIIWIQA